jgi:hypothetical protein
MNHINLERACDINKYSKEPIITNITERFIYKAQQGVFDDIISCVIKSTDGFFKTFRFPSERAFANALSELEINRNFTSKDLLKYVR